MSDQSKENARLFRLAIVVMAGSLGLLGCKPKITGQVFIVTQAGLNIRLGDVEVDLVDKSQAVEWIQKKRAAIGADKAALNAEIEKAQAEVEKARAEVEKEQKDYNAFLATSPLSTNADYVTTQAELAGIPQKLTVLKQKKDSLRAQNDRLRKAAYAAYGTPQKFQLDLSLLDNQANSVFEPWRTPGAAQHDEEMSGARARAGVLGGRGHAPQRQPPPDEPSQVKTWRQFLVAVPAVLSAITEQIYAANYDAKSLPARLAEIERNVNSEASAKLHTVESRLRTAESRLESAVTNLKNFQARSTESFFDDFSPAVVQKAVSDADGNFSLVCPRNGLTIFAKAQRAVGERQEKYYWLVNAPVAAESAQFLLSNSKLIQADPDGYQPFVTP
jgi:small-conductance mechanosensitive channel